MKKILSLILIPVMMLSLSSCSMMLYGLGQMSYVLGEDLNEGQKYSPFPEDFEDLTPTFSVDDGFYPTKDALYYFATDDSYNNALYRADSNGTVCIMKDSTDKEMLDGMLCMEEDRICFSASRYSSDINPFDFEDSSSVSHIIYYIEDGMEKPELLYKAEDSVYAWHTVGDTLLYTVADMTSDHEVYPYDTYPLKTVDMKTGEVSVIAEDGVVHFGLSGSRVVFISFNDEDSSLHVSSCDTDGKNMSLHGKINSEINPRYAFFDSYYVTDKYVVLWGDTGVGDSETDIVVFSLEDGKTYHHTSDRYSGAFSVGGDYAFITYHRYPVDYAEDPEPMENEGIFRVDLITGETELLSREMAFCVHLIALDGEKVCGYKYYYSEDNTSFTNEIFRLKVNEKPSLVYTYEE